MDIKTRHTMTPSPHLQALATDKALIVDELAKRERCVLDLTEMMGRICPRFQSIFPS